MSKIKEIPCLFISMISLTSLTSIKWVWFFHDWQANHCISQVFYYYITGLLLEYQIIFQAKINLYGRSDIVWIWILLDFLFYFYYLQYFFKLSIIWLYSSPSTSPHWSSPIPYPPNYFPQEINKTKYNNKTPKTIKQPTKF